MISVHLTDFVQECFVRLGIQLGILLLRSPQSHGLYPRSTLIGLLLLSLPRGFPIGLRPLGVLFEFQHHRRVLESVPSSTAVVHLFEQSAEDRVRRTPLGHFEQGETGRILAGEALVLIRQIFSTFSLVLFESLLARAYCVAVSTLPPTILHVGVQDLDLRVLSIFVLCYPRFGLEALVADQALVWICLLIHSIIFHLLRSLNLMYLFLVSSEAS